MNSLFSFAKKNTITSFNEIDPNHLKIAILSQNAVNKSVGVDIPDIISVEPDVYIEMTQEDTRTNAFGNFDTLVKKTFIDTFSDKKTVVSMLPYSPRNMVMKMFLSGGVVASGDVKIETGKIAVNKDTGNIESIITPLVTKGGVYIKLTVPGHKSILFLNMHLPMKKIKDSQGVVTDDLGYETRKLALQNILNKLVTDGTLDKETTLVAGGDLNFRITHEGKDQLSEFLKEKITLDSRLHEVRELEFLNDDDKKFTCKFDQPDETCRETVEPPSIDTASASPEDIKAVEVVQTTCGNSERFPSRCDRFIVSESNTGSITVDAHKGHFFRDIKSDHNAIYSVIKVNDPVGTAYLGGKRKSRKTKRSKKSKKVNKKSRKSKN